MGKLWNKSSYDGQTVLSPKVLRKKNTVTSPTVYLSTWGPPWGPMSFAPMAASRRIDRDINICQKDLILVVFRLTSPWNDPMVSPIYNPQRRRKNWIPHISEACKLCQIKYPNYLFSELIVAGWQLIKPGDCRTDSHLTQSQGDTCLTLSVTPDTRPRHETWYVWNPIKFQ